MANAAIAEFSTGRDIQIVFQSGDPTAQIVEMSIQSGWKVSQRVSVASVKPLNTSPREAHIPQGYEWSLTLERGSPDADNFFRQVALGYWAGGTLYSHTITTTIIERNGSTSTYQYVNCACHLSDGGNWTASNPVTMTVSGFASDCNIL